MRTEGHFRGKMRALLGVIGNQSRKGRDRRGGGQQVDVGQVLRAGTVLLTGSTFGSCYGTITDLCPPQLLIYSAEHSSQGPPFRIWTSSRELLASETVIPILI